MATDTRTVVFTSLFALISGLAAWFMHVQPSQLGIPKDFDSAVASAKLPNGVNIKTEYTGIVVVDKVLTFLVTAFIYGSAGWDRTFQLHQIYFLVTILPVLAVWNAEALRSRNKWAILSL